MSLLSHDQMSKHWKRTQNITLSFTGLHSSPLIPDGRDATSFALVPISSTSTIIIYYYYTKTESRQSLSRHSSKSVQRVPKAVYWSETWLTQRHTVVEFYPRISHSKVRHITTGQLHHTHGYRLVGWETNVPFQEKIGYIRDMVLSGDLVPPG